MVRVCNVLLTLLFVLELHSVRARRRRQCKHSSLAIENMKIEFYHKQSTKILADGNITRYLTFNWTLSDANISKCDGFLIRMRSPGIKSIAPFQDRDASLTKLWIRTNNVTECSNANGTKSVDIGDSIKSSEEYCWCNSSTCYFLAGLNCLPSTSQFRSPLGVFYAIPNTRTSITYETKYRAQYTMEVYPYYRQFKRRRGFRQFVQATWSCAEDLSVISNISVTEANRKCCEKDLADFSPLNVQKSDFVFEPETTTINVSISWVPPVMKSFLGTAIRIYPESQVEPSKTPNYTAIQFEGTYNENSPCAIHNRTESVIIYNLQPNMSYTISINTLQSSISGIEACRYGGCKKSLWISTNLCHSDNLKCSDNAYCEYDAATFTANCECKPGFKGNGVRTNSINGTGCEPVASSPSPIHQQTTNEDVGYTSDSLIVPTTSQATVICQNTFLYILIAIGVNVSRYKL